jgi:hypothetical protein
LRISLIRPTVDQVHYVEMGGDWQLHLAGLTRNLRTTKSKELTGGNEVTPGGAQRLPRDPEFSMEICRHGRVPGKPAGARPKIESA